MSVSRFALVGGLAAMLVGANTSSARADAQAENPRSMTVMTQNLYQSTELEHVLAATTLEDFLSGVATDYSNVIATNFPERANALATEIAEAHSVLVGLQEVALWRTQCPYDPTSPPETVSYDFLQILLDALAADGMQYRAVNVRDNFDVSGVGVFPSCEPSRLMGIRLTERSAILVRTDLPTDELTVSNPQQGGFVHVSVLPTLNGPFPLGGGWLSVDVKTRGKAFRFITTHLDGFSTAVAGEQAQELIGGPANTNLPTVIAGDFNSETTDPAYGTLTAAGFTDEWMAEHPSDPGLTCCQVPPDSITNPVSHLTTRIDFLFARGSFAPLDVRRVGFEPSARTSSGLWPSDHAGLVGTLAIGPQPSLTPSNIPMDRDTGLMISGHQAP